ncbi:MAG TPA: NADH-quinone oxidoreductase subunit N [Tepidisphaeraceae bacterium]|nr:NADH-quinone oxidoreductase subunit N [Tepidisphaeraceae bacterium]
MQTFDNNLIRAMAPELLLCAVACVLFLLGVSSRAAARRVAPVIAAAALLAVFGWQVMATEASATLADQYQTFRVFEFATYIKMLAAGVGVLFVLLAWPTNREATGNSALDFGADAGEFFGLMLLSIAGVMLVAGANDMILLFLGLELASIPTYIMVSISRPLPVAQEAGVKYFFLGAMSAGIMLFGFSYLYGTTGTTSLHEIATRFSESARLDTGATQTLTAWQQLAVVMLIAGFAFKIAAVPLHFYAGDVYQGAATPVTAFLSFVPKTSGFVALIKLLFVISGGAWESPEVVQKLLWVMAVLTMTAGNVLGLLQFNVKRVLAYSSIAHTGYMLVGLTVYAVTGVGADANVKQSALQGVLFYLASYGIMNAGAFGVLMLLPAREDRGLGLGRAKTLPATSAETFEDLAGTGRRNVGLGLAMAVCCFSLIGLPLTVGFFGKLFLIRPALDAAHGEDRTWMIWLVVITMINAAISAAYYLRIVATMFLRPEPTDLAAESEPPTSTGGGETSGTGAALARPMPILIAIGLSVFGTLLFGALPPATQVLDLRASSAANIEAASLSTYVPMDDEDEPATSPAAAAR